MSEPMYFTADDYMACDDLQRTAIDAWVAEHWLHRERIMRMRFTRNGRVVATELSLGLNGKPRAKGDNIRTVERGARVIRPFPVPVTR